MIHPALMVHVHMQADGKEQKPYVTIELQVWNDGEYITTIDLRENVDPDPWTLQRGDCLELWASQMGRQVARMIEDNFMNGVANSTLNHADQFLVVTQVTPDTAK